jgi:hypothetical protein
VMFSVYRYVQAPPLHSFNYTSRFHISSYVVTSHLILVVSVHGPLNVCIVLTSTVCLPCHCIF